MLAELRQLMTTSGGVGTAALMKEMGISTKPRAASAPVGSPVKHLTQIVRTYTCSTCGHRWTRTLSIADTESLCGVDKTTGAVVVADAKHGPYTMNSWTHSCSRCDTFIEKMDRQELERRYKEARMYLPFPREEK
jgi:hypothetical protein